MIHGLDIRIPEILKIKCGRKAEREVQIRGTDRTFHPPEKLDHIIVTRTRRLGVNFELASEIMDSMPSECRSNNKLVRLPILLHSDEIDEVFPTEYACYVGKKRVCHGNGKKAQRRDRQGQRWLDTWSEVKCTCPALEQGRCKPKGRLHCSIVSPKAPVAGGQAILRTASIITVSEMLGSLIDIRHKLLGLAWIPMWLVLEPKQVEPDGRATTVYCWHVETVGTDVRELQRQILERRRERAELGSGDESYKALIAAAERESDEEQAEISGEFYPEHADATEPFDIESGETVSDGGGGGPRDSTWVPEGRQPEPPAAAKPAPSEPARRTRKADTPAPATAPATVPAPTAVGGVELDETTRKLYELQDEAARKAGIGDASAGPSPEATPVADATREREPGEDDDVEPAPAPGQRSLLGEEPKPAEPPRHGNAAMRNRIGNGGSKR